MNEGEYYIDNNDNVIRVMDLSSDDSKKVLVKDLKTEKLYETTDIQLQIFQEYKRLPSEKIPQILLDIAKQKGFKKGCIYDCAAGNGHCKLKSNLWHAGTAIPSTSRPDLLTDGCGGAVYEDGKWATLIKKAEWKVYVY